MTPEMLTGLSCMLIEVREWIREMDPWNLDAELVDAALDAVMRVRHALVSEGAR